jgi:hypothetical protein
VTSRLAIPALVTTAQRGENVEMKAEPHSPAERERIVRKLLSLAPAGSCRVVSLIIACRESGLDEGELVSVVGTGESLVLGEWAIRYSPDAGRISFAKRCLPPSTNSAPGAGAFDAIEVGLAARQLCEASWAKGGELTATEAVTRILQERGLRK